MDKFILTTPSELSIIVEEAINKAIIRSSNFKNEKIEIPELLSIDDAAKYLNLAKQTLYGFTSKGVIPYLKKGKKLYFKKSEIDKWINEGKKI